MNIALNCKISLSKKLRAILKSGGTVTLTTSELVDGRGDGILVLASDGDLSAFNELPEDMKNETSIMLTPIGIADEAPSATTQTHASIFNSIPGKGNREPVVDRLAAVHAPEKREISKAIKKEAAPIPEAFPQLEDEECRSYVTDLQGLIDAANSSVKAMKADIDIDSAKNDRERAVLLEMKEKAEAIGMPAWIVNDKVGRLTINDLDVSLPLNEPFDLGSLSARKIIGSRDLRGLLKDKYVRFISPEEIVNYVSASLEEEDRGSLEVFDNVDEARSKVFKAKEVAPTKDRPERSIRRRDEIMDDDSGENVINLENEDLDRPTEDESMVLNLTKNSPKAKSFSNGPAPQGQHTVHGNNKPKSTSVKPITRRDA